MASAPFTRRASRPQALDADRPATGLLAGIQAGITVMTSTGDSTRLKVALVTGVEHLRGTATPVRA